MRGILPARIAAPERCTPGAANGSTKTPPPLRAQSALDAVCVCRMRELELRIYWFTTSKYLACRMWGRQRVRVASCTLLSLTRPVVDVCAVALCVSMIGTFFMFSAVIFKLQGLYSHFAIVRSHMPALAPGVQRSDVSVSSV